MTNKASGTGSADSRERLAVKEQPLIEPRIVDTLVPVFTKHGTPAGFGVIQAERLATRLARQLAVPFAYAATATFSANARSSA